VLVAPVSAKKHVLEPTRVALTGRIGLGIRLDGACACRKIKLLAGGAKLAG